MDRTALAPFWVILTTTVIVALGSTASAEPAVPTDSSATQSPQPELRRLAEQVSTLATLQRDIAGDTARALEMLDTTTKQLQSIHDEVDTPLISELWFGFVSDRFNAGLNRLFGLESGSSAPLWAAGALSLLLVVLKALSFFMNMSNPDSRSAEIVGKAFGILVSLYLIVLTGSLVMLALRASDSPVERFGDQLAASDRLTTDMQGASARIGVLLDRLEESGEQIDRLEKIVTDQAVQRGVTVQFPSSSAADLKTIEQLSATHLPLVPALRTDMAGLREELEQVRGGQHGTLWTALVALAALASFVTAAVALYAVYER